RIEAEPAEKENNGAQDAQRNVVTGNRIGAAILVKLADAWPKRHRTRQADRAAASMHHTGTGEVHCAVAPTHRTTQIGQPATAPYPVADNRVYEHSYPEAHDD